LPRTVERATVWVVPLGPSLEFSGSTPNTSQVPAGVELVGYEVISGTRPHLRGMRKAPERVLNGARGSGRIGAVTLNWGRALSCAAAAGTAFIAWKKLGASTREELRLRARCAGSTFLGNPVAYRVTLLKDGAGPGIAVATGPSVISQCTVVGVNGHGFNLFTGPEPGDGDADDDYEDDGEDEDMSASETEPAQNVVPAACEDGHVSWPGSFIRLYDTSVYAARTPARVGDCPECGKPRTVLVGEYRAGADGFVTRGELPPAAFGLES
jgi:hypothetical protein